MGMGSVKDDIFKGNAGLLMDLPAVRSAFRSSQAAVIHTDQSHTAGSIIALGGYIPSGIGIILLAFYGFLIHCKHNGIGIDVIQNPAGESGHIISPNRNSMLGVNIHSGKTHS